jgi:transposase-like protein
LGYKTQTKISLMKAKRRRHEATFKVRVALEAIKGIKTIQQIAKEFDVHPGQVSDWKTTLQERLPNVFDRDAASRDRGDFDRERADLHSKIGELTVQVDFLQKKSKQLCL